MSLFDLLKVWSFTTPCFCSLAIGLGTGAVGTLLSLAVGFPIGAINFFAVQSATEYCAAKILRFREGHIQELLFWILVSGCFIAVIATAFVAMYLTELVVQLITSKHSAGA
jgi:hypothetical protein